MGELVREKDWEQTPLGPAANWPGILRSAVSICLGSSFPIAIYWGPELVLIYNDAWRPIAGAKHPWALGRPAREVWPEIWDTIGPLFEQVMTTGEATRSRDQLLAMRRHGYVEECYFDYTFSPVRGESGRVEGVFNAVLETTERVIGERRMRVVHRLAGRAAEARTAEMACRIGVDTLSDAALDVPFARLYLAPDGVEATPAGTAGPDAGGAWPVAEVMQTGIAKRVEFDAAAGRVWSWPEPPRAALVLPISRAGSERPYGVLVAGVSGGRALDAEYRAFYDLVTSHIAQALANAEAHEQERRRAEALAEIDRAKTAFFSNVSHEFRTPLTLMLGPLEEMLAMRGELPEAARELTAMTHRNGLRLQKLVNTLLDFSRIEAGRMEPRYEATDLAKLTAELASTFRSAVEKAGLELRVECAALPEPVYVDREMWEKVVLNLLSNAFRHTFEGRIVVRLEAEVGRATLSVEDTGIGIPEHELPHLFERFHRVAGARGRSQEGSGIGLALTAELVKLHEGTVEAWSRQGQGSRFTVSIPMGTAEQRPVPAAAGGSRVPAAAYVEEAANSVTRQSAGSGGSVLVVDDNADMREYVARLLAERYAVATAANGEEALASVLANPPDVVLSDVMMPGLDGFGLLQALRGNPKTAAIPVILVSARAGEEASVEGLDAGASDYLAKPFTSRELLARVGVHMETVRARKEAEASRDAVVVILESITDAFATFDRDWCFVYVNPQAERLVAMRRDELLGKSHWEIFPETVGTELERQYRRAVNEQVAVEFEYFHAQWERWFSIKGYPTREGGLSIYFQDVTERKLAESQLRESQQRLRAIYDGTYEYIGLLATDGTLLEANRASLEFAQNQREDVVGRKFWNTPWFTGTPGAPELVRESVARAAAGEFIRYEATVRRPSGEWQDFDISFHPVRNNQGEVVLIVPEGRNITERKLVERALREQDALREEERRRWREIFAHLPAAVAILQGPDHVMEDCNAEYQRLSGRRADQLLGKTVREVFPEVVAQGYIDLLDGVYRTGIPHVGSESLLRLDVRGDGVWRDEYVNFVYHPTRDDSGAIDGIFVHAVKVTDLVEARKRIEETNRRLTLALTATRAHVYDWDLKTGRVVRERGLEEITGWRDEETPATAAWWWEQVHPDDAARLRAALETIGAEQTMLVSEYRIRHRSGEWRWVADHALLHRDAAGEMARVVGIMIDITARKRAEEEVRQSRERFQAAAGALSDLIWTNNAKGEMEGEQPGWGGFTGQTYGEYQGYGWSGAVHPEDRQPTVDAWNRAVAQRSDFAFEHRVRRHDGVWRLFAIRAVPLLDERGAIREWVGVHTDITDRRQAEEALRQSEERFRQVAESMPQVVWSTNPLGVLDYVNARWTELTGCDLAATNAGSFRRHMPAEDLAVMDAAWVKAARTGEPSSFECRFPRVADGSLRWHLVRSIPVRNANGEIVKWLGTSTDIDEQKRAAEALRLSEWRLRFTLDAAHFGSWELDPGTRRWQRSGLHDAIFGYETPLRDWTYERFLEHVLAEDRDGVDRLFRESLEVGGAWNCECRIRRAGDGAIRWIWISGKTAPDAYGMPGLMLGLTSDITERKEAEAALARANQELVRANADLEQFGYSASHDLQEPLRNVMIYSELLARRYGSQLGPEALEILEYLKGGASRMEILIRDLLEYTQVRKVESLEESDAIQAMADALANLANGIEESGAEITHGHLPRVAMHQVHLQQLLQNLIGNALKYRSQRTPRVAIEAKRRGAEWIFSVSDNGIGIDAQYRERIFGLFKRLHTAQEYSGTGIGLAICQRIVERYGGRIWVESEVGKGSTFFFTVPA